MLLIVRLFYCGGLDRIAANLHLQISVGEFGV